METMETLTHIDLFAGVGGFAAGFEAAGIQIVAHVEIDKQCQSVIRKHWPDHLILSDVCEAGAHNLPYADIISFGSPCQGMALPGFRKGLADERSGLFFEAVRIINEVQPQFAIWENVPGALSSNAGRDFQAVLSQMLGADLPMPRSGRWARSGMARSGQRTLAWRVLDSQYFGLAQRRKRVFVVLDLRGERAIQILLEPEGVRRDSPPRREKGQGFTRSASSGVGNSSGSRGLGYEEEVAPPCRAGANGTNRVPTIAFSTRQGFIGEGVELSPTLSAGGGGFGAPSITFQQITPPLGAAGGVTSMPTLHKNNSDLDFLVAVLQPWEAVGFYGNMGTQGGGFAVEVAPPLKDAKNMSSVAYRMRTIDNEPIGYSPSGFGTYVEAPGTLRAEGGDCGGGSEILVASPHIIPQAIDVRNMRIQSDEISGTIQAKENGSYSLNYTNPVLIPKLGVRRLLPVETERLQGFYDGWTDGQADTVRYRQMGNAVSVAVTSWIGQRIVRNAELQD
jgi:site-specific DNA-cytosine methylase